MTSNDIWDLDPRQELQDRLINSIKSQVSAEHNTLEAHAAVKEALQIAEIFGFVPQRISTYHGLLVATYRKLPDCHLLLPLFELLDRFGFSAERSSDYPSVHNRDYFLRHTNGTNLRIECYFTELNCRKVAVGSTVEYRLECGTAPAGADGDPGASSTSQAPDDDIPF